MIRAWIVFGIATLVLGSPLSHSQRDTDENGVRTYPTPKFDPKNVAFYLWTRDNPSSYETILPGETGSNFNNGRQTKVIAHGWLMNGLSEFVIDMKDAFLRQGDHNVISIDCETDFASYDNYELALAIINVGAYTASFINSLVTNGANIKDFHIIGFSMGAHLAGAIGAYTNDSVARVTGLDPGTPSISLDGTNGKLDPSDGDFVDIVHTNTENVPEQMGHADFFPNGGFIQPGCPTNSGCSHSRSNQYYIESITSNAFRSKNCSSYGEFLAGNCDLNAEAFMGNGVSTDARGNFYLQTNEESPFAQG